MSSYFRMGKKITSKSFKRRVILVSTAPREYEQLGHFFEEFKVACKDDFVPKPESDHI